MQEYKSYDKEEILRALKVMVRPQHVVELRTVGKNKSIGSGYFTDLEQLTEVACKLSGKVMGVYITLNPLCPELPTELDSFKAKVRKTTSDCHAVERRWLPIDFDPVRPSGISSTEAEHQAALETLNVVMAYLRGLGWSDPIVGDSGNGGHLLYSVDLPNDDASKDLIKDCLSALCLQFTDSKVSVDVQNFNAARIWKLYGTLAAKGTSTAERPHRLARILSVPDSIIPIPVPLLKELASRNPINPTNPKNPASGTRGRGKKVAVAKWIGDNQVPFSFDASWGKHHKWVMQCPWNTDHTNKSAFIIQFEDGGVMARCLHSSCAGNGWPELRDIYEAGWSEKQNVAANCRIHYEQTAEGIVWLKTTSEAVVHVPLTNFQARIAKDITQDDGLETTHLFEMEAELGDRAFTFQVPSSQFASMNWVTEQLGARAILYPGMGTRDHARAAIQLSSTDVGEEKVYTHTGWTDHEGQAIYLHGNGALGSKGRVEGVQVQLPNCLQPFSLNLPKNSEEGIAAIRSSLGFLDLAADSITFPLYAALWRSVLGTCDFSVFLTGLTGIGKTVLAALMQQHFGAGFSERKLPGSWASTSNSLEALAFTTKDSLLVVDDFMMTGSQNDIARSHKEADRLLRAQGNNAGRGRMRADATLRPAKPPRGLILATGEDVPRGSSLQARMLIVELQKSDLNWQNVSKCQSAAASGLYAQTMAAFIVWVANHEATKKEMPKQVQQYRNEATSQTKHKRTPDIIANMFYGLKMFLQFAVTVEAIKSTEAKKLEERGWQALGDTAAVQSFHQASQDPVERFLGLISAALSTDKAYLADNGYTPEAERRECIGWVVKEQEGDLVMLEPDVAFGLAQKMAHQQNEPLAIGKRTLWRRLSERGLLARKDSDHNTYSWNHQEKRQRVICLRAEDLLPTYDKKRDCGIETDFSFGFNE